MTDRERAEAFARDIRAKLDDAFAAARREGGAEAAMKQFHELEFVSLNELKEAERRGAEGMRERAARAATDCLGVEVRYDGVALRLLIKEAILALPLEAKE